MTQIRRIDSNERRSRAVIHSGTIYLGGQVADDAVDAIDEQMRQVLDKIDALLAEAGSHKSKILTATIWLKTMDDYDGVNRIWDAWVDPTNPPARACITADMADSRYLVEIAMTAAI